MDAVLSSKSLYCQNNGIELKFMVEGELLDFMEDMDISALFGNMLDNAIECAERQTEKDRRLIGLYMNGEKQFLRIRTENYCAERLSFRGECPLPKRTGAFMVMG